MAFYSFTAIKNNIIYGLYPQIVLPCSAYYYFPVFGAWMIGAAVSLSDPGKKHIYINIDLSVPASSWIILTPPCLNSQVSPEWLSQQIKTPICLSLEDVVHIGCKMLVEMEEHVLDTNGGKQLS